MTKAEIIALIAARIEGQGTSVDASSVLPSILNGIIGLIDDVAAEIPSVPSASDNLASLTCVSEADSFSDATDLTAEEAAEALGISEDDLASLFEGSFIRLSYADGASFLGVDSASASSVSLGNGAVVISYATEKYAIAVA